MVVDIASQFVKSRNAGILRTGSAAIRSAIALADEVIAIVTADQGTGAFWNATTRLLDGFKLLSVPETGINIDAVPGPPRPGHLPRPVPASVRGHAVVVRGRRSCVK